MKLAPRKPSIAMSASSAETTPSVLHGAADRLRRLVVQGQLGGGQPLIETDLAERLGASRSTVREALRRLESEGLVVARKRGLQVRRLTRGDVTDLYDVREVLEGLAARRAAERFAAGASAAERGRLASERRIWVGARSEFGIAAFSEQNRSLHAMVIEMAGNAHLPRMLDQTLLALFASQFRPWLVHAKVAEAAAEHVDLLDALKRGAAGEAERVMRNHVRHSARAITTLPDEAFD